MANKNNNNSDRYGELHNHIDFLLERARRKCDDTCDAEDLTQDTLLAALAWMERGNRIDDMRAWLCRVLDRRYNDMLRRRYRHPVMHLGDDFDIIDDDDAIERIAETDEAAAVRREIAHLSHIYREVIVRHYMNGESVEDIASALGVPEGTVKSRLYSGRERIKKGITDMENYEKQSYAPIKLWVSNSGSCGLNWEPMSLVNDDLIVQNLLYLAYEKPVAVEELSRAIGIPAAYVEPIVERLTNAELMKKVGNKYYTDFMIFTQGDDSMYIPDQVALVKENFGAFWDSIDGELQKIRVSDWYLALEPETRDSLELYFAFRCLDYGIYDSTCEVLGEYQTFPMRPDGGSWIAFGHLYTDTGPKETVKPTKSYGYSGWRYGCLENYDGNRRVTLQIYGVDCFPNYVYHSIPEGMRVKNSDNIDYIYTELLYLIHTGADIEKTHFDPEYLKAIPWLTKCRLLRTVDGKPHVNVPILDSETHSKLLAHEKAAKAGMREPLMHLFSDFFPGREAKLPPHLDSVPKQKRYMFAGNALVVATIREAMERDRLTNGHYDDEENQCPPAMVLVIEK